jgi:hypothetical protein
MTRHNTLCNEIGLDHSFPNISWLPLHRCVLLEHFSEEDKTKFFDFSRIWLLYFKLFFFIYIFNINIELFLQNINLPFRPVTIFIIFYNNTLRSFISCKHCLYVSQQLTRESKSELPYMSFLCVFSHVSIDEVTDC